MPQSKLERKYKVNALKNTAIGNPSDIPTKTSTKIKGTATIKTKIQNTIFAFKRTVKIRNPIPKIKSARRITIIPIKILTMRINIPDRMLMPIKSKA